MTGKRKRYAVEFKAKIALEALPAVGCPRRWYSRRSRRPRRRRADHREPEKTEERDLPHRAGAPALLDALDLVHGIRELQSRRGRGRGERLWPWSRMTGWRAVHAVMQAARLDGPHASPKGLRHGFGVAAVSAGIPLNLVQKWLGHAQLTTTAIYANAVGAEEKDIARMMRG
jgi:integrase